jgi:CheY-like chemotaxis protein
MPFERLGAEQSGVEGTGLGLAVAKRLVEAMEGAIGVESVPDKGTTFWVEFLLTDSPLRLANLPAETVENRQFGSSEERCVLYIEDNLSNLALIERVMERRPAIKLLTARNGVEGLRMTREHLPDLILLDLNLPDIHGLEVLNRLRSDPLSVEVPVIVISADATSRQRKRLVEAGAAEYLTKPLNINKFLNVLDESLLGQPS